MTYNNQILELEKLALVLHGEPILNFCRSFKKSFRLSDLQYCIFLAQLYFETYQKADIKLFVDSHRSLFGDEIVDKTLEMIRVPGETDEDLLRRVSFDTRLVLLSEYTLAEEANAVRTIGI